jgi:hypothetical protein
MKAKYFAKSKSAARKGSFVIVYPTSCAEYVRNARASSFTHKDGFEAQCALIKSNGYVEIDPKELRS